MIKRLTAFTIALFSILTLFGCTENLDDNNETISIVTTIFPAYDFAKNIAGKSAKVSMLIAPGSEVHSFEPSPQDMIKIQKCDLFIYTGGESDEWVNTLLSSNEYKNLHVLRMMDCVDILNEEHIEGMESEDHHEEDSHHESEEADEHVWTSPKNAVKISESIMKQLKQIDPDNAKAYGNNFNTYKEKLNAVDMRLTDVSNQIQNKTLVFADRFPMRYFAEEYGFDYYAAFPGCSSQTEPSSSTIVFLIDKVKQQNIPAVFCIEFSNGKLADTICEETSAKKYTLYTCHNISKEDFDKGVGYIELMQKNADTLKEAFGI